MDASLTEALAPAGRRDLSDVLLTRSMRGAECWTGHRMVRASVSLQLRPPIRKKKASRKLIVKACPSVQPALETAIEESLQHVDEVDPSLPRNTDDLTREWETISSRVQECSVNTLDFSSRNHLDWFGLMTINYWMCLLLSIIATS